MAVMGLKINGGGGGIDTSLADTLAGALFGDPEQAMKEADLRSTLAARDFVNRKNAAEAAKTEFELRRRQQNIGTYQDYLGGLVEPPAPVEVDDVAIPVPSAAPRPVDPAAAFGTILGGGEPPVPVEYTDPNVGIMPEATGELFDDGGPVPVDAPQAMPGPQPDLPVSAEEQSAYQRAVAARRAQAAMIVGGGGNAEQMAKGLAIGEGNVQLESSDPETRQAGLVRYTGKTPGEIAGADIETVQKLRKEFSSQPVFQKWEIVNSGYQNIVSAMDTLATMQTEDDPRRGPADMRLIYNYLKLLDPNTGIKEGEYSTAEEAGGLVAPYLNLYNSIVAGDKLDQPTRMAFTKQAGEMYDIATKDLDPLIKQIGGEAKLYEIDPERVIRRPQERAPYVEKLPYGVTEDDITRVMAANPGIDRITAIKRVMELASAGGQ